YSYGISLYGKYCVNYRYILWSIDIRRTNKCSYYQKQRSSYRCILFYIQYSPFSLFRNFVTSIHINLACNCSLVKTLLKQDWKSKVLDSRKYPTGILPDSIPNYTDKFVYSIKTDRPYTFRNHLYSNFQCK